MIVTWAKYTSNGGGIIAEIDEQEMNIPDDPRNMHRRVIAEWEAAGGSIEPYIEPVISPFKPLLPWQFRAMLDIAGIAGAIDGAIAAIPDTEQKAVAKSKLEYALAFHRDDPLISMLAPVVGLTGEQIDEMWQQAAQL